MQGIEYTNYTPPLHVKAICLLVGAAAVSLIAYIFYESLIISGVAGIIGAAFAVPLYKRRVVERRVRKLTDQFRDLLGSLSSSLGAGDNINYAFRSAEQDMVLRYGEDGYITRELRRINVGLNSNMNIEDLLLDLGRRSGVEDIVGFAEVFETCYRRGGNIREIINRCSKVLADKLDIQQEIRVLIAGKKSEQNMMLVMPVVFTAILKNMGGGVADMGSVSGRISTTLALGMFISAYLIGKKILSIGI